jgi:methyltransferase (TIGR00027 family)
MIGSVQADRASRTAVLVCQGRAVAQGRLAAGRFDDPTALVLLRPGERAPVELARRGVAPRGFTERMSYELLRANADVMVARTVAIDDALRARPTSQVVILGAGLDGRAWRMPELAATTVFEVDHPASQGDKLGRVGGLRAAAGAVRFVSVDFGRDDLDAALNAGGHRPVEATAWIWEGVVPYLTPAEVESTVRVVAARSAPRSRLVVSYQTGSLTAALGRLLVSAAAIVARSDDPLAGERRRSSWSPQAMRALLGSHGFAVAQDDDLLAIARRLGIDVTNRRSLAAGRVAVADVP